MIPRTLEPEVMDTPEEALDYDAMDHRAVNRVFVDDFLAALTDAERSNKGVSVLDAGTGTAQIPIELCGRPGTFLVTAIDLSAEMLKVAARNVTAAGLDAAIRLELVDSKRLLYTDGLFDAVMSNSIVHHIPEPRAVLAELVRVLKPGGLLFVRDLLRPGDYGSVDALVDLHAVGANTHQRQMFRDSLCAALTLDEMRGLLAGVGLDPESVAQTTDRHWTVSARK